MINFRTGNILDTDAEALVNTVNCVGVMGRGVALQFKNAYPENFKQYKKACDMGYVQPGRMLVYETGQLTYPKFIINFPTKRHWKGKSRIEDIESGLDALVSEIRHRKIESVAIPPLGSGLGGLQWKQVKLLIQDRLSELDDVNIIVFEPTDAVPFTKSTDVPDMTIGRAAMVLLIDKYLAGLMDPFVTLLEVQKLMYFMQETGEPLRLRYEKGSYGPYSNNLRHVLKKVEGHLIFGYGDGGDDPLKQLSLVPGSVKDAEQFMNDSSLKTKAHLDKVMDLVSGFETAFGLELLATVHWIRTKNDIESDEQLVQKVHAWNARKRKFTPYQIKFADQTLVSKGWL